MSVRAVEVVEPSGKRHQLWLEGVPRVGDRVKFGVDVWRVTRVTWQQVAAVELDVVPWED